MVSTIKSLDIFVRISNCFCQNEGHLSRFQIVGHPELRSDSKSVGRHGLTDKSVDLRSWRQGTGDRIPVENKHVKKI